MEIIHITSKNKSISDAVTMMKIGKVDVKVNYTPKGNKFPLMTISVDYKSGDYFGTFDVWVDGKYSKESNFKNTDHKITKIDVTGYDITGVDYESNSTDKQLITFSKKIMDNLIKDKNFVNSLKSNL